MPAWPGGPCPDCGEDMPALVIHCRSCRRLLNDDLEEDTVVEPAFVPLKEIDDVPTVQPRGVYDGCPACGRELRISRKFAGRVIRCKHCEAGFTFGRDLGPAPSRNAYFADCPHCSRELRVGTKYLGQRVACKFCAGELRFGTAETASR